MRACADALTLSVVQVLQYLRKRLSAGEMRAEQTKVRAMELDTGYRPVS